MKSKQEQQAVLVAILDKYDKCTQKLYSDILRMYTEKGAHSTKTAMRNEILDMVKEATK